MSLEISRARFRIWASTGAAHRWISAIANSSSRKVCLAFLVLAFYGEIYITDKKIFICLPFFDAKGSFSSLIRYSRYSMCSLLIGCTRIACQRVGPEKIWLEMAFISPGRWVHCIACYSAFWTWNADLPVVFRPNETSEVQQSVCCPSRKEYARR